VLHDLPHGVYLHLVTHYGRRHPLVAAHIDAASVLIALPTTVLLAWLSYRLLESPFLNLKERWTVLRVKNAAAVWK
jgi:peptidoglycan/LPS O-acetylase OafA/YrhL